MTVFLASVSPRRKALLRAAGVRFRVIAPSYHEPFKAGEKPRAAVLRHALAKALSVRRRVANGVVIGSDTVVYFNKRIIGKPKDRKHAFRILSAMQGRTHQVFTGVALVRFKAHRPERLALFAERSDVRLKPMDRAAIGRYFRTVNPLDKAGAYAAQSKKGSIVMSVKGSFSNVVGLPVERLCVKLRKL